MGQYGPSAQKRPRANIPQYGSSYNLGRFVLEISPAPPFNLGDTKQSKDTNFYSNIELGGMGDFFPTFETKVVARLVSSLLYGTRTMLVVLNQSERSDLPCHILNKYIFFFQMLMSAPYGHMTAALLLCATIQRDLTCAVV